MKEKLQQLQEQIETLAEMPVNDFMQLVEVLQKLEPIIQEIASIKKQIKSLPVLEKVEITVFHKEVENKMRRLQKKLEKLEF